MQTNRLNVVADGLLPLVAGFYLQQLQFHKKKKGAFVVWVRSLLFLKIFCLKLKGRMRDIRKGKGLG